ncbi:MAG: (Fe-S)-binding protein [Desulfobacterales bacterium]|nr:(Fe-S)-binding protein [Desulfobacterales bacterium]
MLLFGPASYKLFGFIPGYIISLIIAVIGIGVFAYIIVRRIAPLVRSAPDHRTDNLAERIKKVIVIWLVQYRQPRYMLAGILHIVIFAGFLVLSIRTLALVFVGFSAGFEIPGFGGALGHAYYFIKDYAATFVLIACVVAAIRRGIFKPARYAAHKNYGTDHTVEAVFVLFVISVLMLTESLFEASGAAYNFNKAGQIEFFPPLSLTWIFKGLLLGFSFKTLQIVHVLMYFLHDIAFFFFLCFLPLGKHFHVITSIFNVFFMKLTKGKIKPVKYGVSEEELDALESFGVKKLEDFTWKHMLDFYSCADCGRCSDQCPANTTGRPLSPRFITIKARDLMFKNYPLSGKIYKSESLVGTIYTEDEIWSCTTCGACEEECPLGIEYIDKIVDLRRGMVEEGMVPQSLQKPLSALEKRGNPYGKMEKKRADWTNKEEFKEECEVKILEKKVTADVLYFVDSITSYDDNIQEIARRTSKILTKARVDFGILGKVEKDSGNEVIRFGEELLFQELRDHNIEAIEKCGAKKIVTADPHAYNTLKNEYPDLPPVQHISQFVAQKVISGDLSLGDAKNPEKIYTYHDPCYLGRHNGVYDDPRNVLDAINGLNRVEMKKSRDRSFCCSGGGLMLFYEPEEEVRMGVLRVNMAAEAGANVIVTACPFCLVNIEDAIKVAGKEGEIEVIDFTALVEEHLV